MNNLQQTIQNNKYILVSEEDAHSSVYDLKLDRTIIINGEEKLANNIKLGDNISFIEYSFYHRKNMEIKLQVNWVGYSRFASTCFSGDCEIQTIVGSVKIKDLKIGDLVVTPRGVICPINCIIKTILSEPLPMMIHPDGLIITEYHPIKLNGYNLVKTNDSTNPTNPVESNNDKWIFPVDSDLFERKILSIDSVYSIGLENESSFMVNGIEVIGLGHGIIDDSVATHPYFGTNQVIKDIYLLNSSGYCEIIPEQILRDPITGLVNHIAKL